MKKVVLATGVFSSLLALAACGGSNGAAPPATSSSGSSGQTSASATNSASVTAATGGSVTVSGTTLTIPAHALAANATVTLSVYTQAAPQPSGGSASLPAGSTFLGGFTISTGGVAIVAPLQVSLTSSRAVSSTPYLAMYNSQSGRYTIVDTATSSGGSIANNDAKGYVGISSVNGASTPYAFVESANSATPAPITLSVTPATPGPYAIGSSETFTAGGADANGNAYAYMPAFSLSNSAIGTIAQSTSQPMSATVTFGSSQQSGAVQVSDARSGATGSLTISVQSLRPANNGDQYTYSGTMTQVFNRMLPSPMPTASSTVSVAQTVTVKGAQTFQGVSNLYDFSTAETDTGALQTTTSQTDTFEGFSSSALPSQLLEYGSNWQDEANDSLADVYPAPIVLDELPEASGNSWTNSPAVTISENETNGAAGAAFSSSRTYNADGSYSETSTYPPGYIGFGTGSAAGELVENSDGSGYYIVPAGGELTFSAPSSGEITYSTYSAPSPGPTAVPLATTQIPVWYSAGPTLYSESDKDLGQAAIPSQCGTSSSFGTSGEELQQTINRLDTILGYTETTTTTTYLVPGYGAACVQMTDLLTSYYDFGGDSQFLFYSPQPYQTTTTTETLGLQQAGTNVTGSSAVTRTPSAMVRVLTAHTAFTRAIEKQRAAIERSFATSSHAMILAHKKGTL